MLFGASWGLLHTRLLGKGQIVDTGVYQHYGDAVVSGQLPYRDFALEYPPAALPVFVLPALGPEVRYRTLFEILMALCGAAAVAVAVAVLAGVGAGRERLFAAAAFMGLAPLALGPVVLTRFDFWPALLVVGGLAALVLRRDVLGCALLGLATAAKVYPLVLLPLALVHLWRRDGLRAAGRGLAAFAVTVAVVIVPFAVLAPDGLAESVRRQLSRPLQLESLGAAALLVAHRFGDYWPQIVSTFGSQNLVGRAPDALATVQTALQATAIVAVWLLFARGPGSEQGVLTASAAAVTAFVAFGKVLSPQFLVWLVPLVPLVAGRAGLAASTLLAVALVLTHLWFPTHYWELVRLEGRPLLVFERDLLLVALCVVLLAAIRPERAAPRSAPRARRARTR